MALIGYLMSWECRVSFAPGRGMFGALHVLREEPTYATALTETDGVAYTLVRGALQLTACPATGIALSLGTLSVVNGALLVKRRIAR